MKITLNQLRALIKEELEAADKQPGWEELENRLLQIDGKEVSRQYEEDMAKLLSRGKVWPAKKTVVMAGDPSRCHANVANLYDSNEGRAGIVTGWALGPNDGIWRQHSWLWWPPKKQLVETTLKRDAYFGFELTKSEADQFSFENY